MSRCQVICIACSFERCIQGGSKQEGDRAEGKAGFGLQGRLRLMAVPSIVARAAVKSFRQSKRPPVVLHTGAADPL